MASDVPTDLDHNVPLACSLTAAELRARGGDVPSGPQDPRTLETSGQGAAGDVGNAIDIDCPPPGARRDLGPIGTAARLVLGGYLFGSVVYGRLVTHNVRPATWALGLIGFPALVLAWHAWRVRRHPARFSETRPLSFVIGALLFLALYFTWWYAPALAVTSDVALIFFLAVAPP